MRQVCLAFALVLGATAVLGACSTTCESGGAAVRYTDGTTNPALTYYETGGPEEPFLDFPAGRSLELPHGLLRTPDLVMVYLAFEARPKSFSLAAGNEALLRVDPVIVSVKNDTCTDFYVRVEAWLADMAPSDAGSNDGG